MVPSDIPPLNATLNAVATVLIVSGFVAVKAGNKTLHRALMLGAAFVSALFLVGYVGHKVLIHGVHTPFQGHGPVATFYHVMLTTHIILAMAIAYLVPRTFAFALKGDFVRHKAWARWVFPIWLYVSVTGVLVYFFLYRWYR